MSIPGEQAVDEVPGRPQERMTAPESMALHALETPRRKRYATAWRP